MARRKAHSHRFQYHKRSSGHWIKRRGRWIWAKKHRSATKKRRKSRKSHGRRLPHMKMGKCHRCHRTIFGGHKGMKTHMRKKHRR